MPESNRRTAAQKAEQLKAEQEAQGPPSSQEEAEQRAQQVSSAAQPDPAADATEPTSNRPPAGFLNADELEPDGKTLTASTSLRNPETNEVEFLEVGTVPPPWAMGTDAEGNPLLGKHLFALPDYGRDPSVIVPLDGSQPPAKDATRPRWAAYAAANGIVVGANAGVLEIKAALEGAGVRVE